jgi:hypothetical protein
MKLATPSRRSYRRPSRQQSQNDFFAKETDSAAFFQPDSQPRLKAGDSFFPSKEPEEQPQAKLPEEQETPAAKGLEEEPMKPKTPEEEEPAAKTPEEEEPMTKSPEEEEPVAAKESEMEEEPGAVAAKCSCGCGGSCVKTADAGEEVKGGSGDMRAKEDEAASSSRVQKKDCTPAQQSVVSSALCSAQSMAGRAFAAASSVVPAEDASTRAPQLDHYERWFGEYDEKRVAFVRKTFSAISSGLAGRVQFRCGCKKNIYAFVLPGGRRKIYLCQLFWGAGSSGFDSQPGILIHEMAHEVSLSIWDKGYGIAKSEALAQKAPRKALHNADSYEFFAETS